MTAQAPKTRRRPGGGYKRKLARQAARIEELEKALREACPADECPLRMDAATTAQFGHIPA